MSWLQEKLPHLPVSVFSIVMGLSGFAIATAKFYHVQWLPKLVADAVLCGDALAFAVLLKINYFPDEVGHELAHPVRVNFFATISISFLLLSIAMYSFWPLLAVLLWWLGAIMQVVITLLTMRFWVQNSYDVKHCNPAWFIPVVGNILIPIVGVDLVAREVSFFFFAFGMFFWIVLFTIIFYRLVFHPPLPAKMVPTLFIFIAPAAVGFVSYMRIMQSWDIFALSLLSLTYFFVLFLGVMARGFVQLSFTLSWWAYTFPMAAATIATTVAFQVTQAPALAVIAWLLLAATATSIVIVSVATAQHVRIGDICVPET